MISTPAVAQTAAAAEADVEELVVTGSRIQRPNLESPTPLTVVGQERLQAQGLENVSDMLVTLPQFAASFGASRTQSTFSGAATSGLNLTNLRNLGSQRSLTLINGRRVPAGAVTSSAVDFNMIPSANIERIEIITGGASAIYGADAVAGVVNIITDRDFEGLELGLSYGMSEERDNINPSAYIRIGQSSDRGHMSATLQYDYQGAVSCANRYLCAEDFSWFPPAAPVRGPAAYSGVPPQGRFLIGAGPAGSGLGALDVTQVNGSFTNASGGLIPFVVAQHGYNRNPRRMLAIPTERIMFAADAEYEVFGGFRAFLELNYGTSETNAPFEGHPFQSTQDLIGSKSLAQGGLEATIPTNNPFVPAAIRAAAEARGDTEISWLQRFDQLGVRGARNQRQFTRLALGGRGELETLFGLGKDWNYELSYVFGRTTLDSITNGLVSRERLYNALRVEQTPGAPAGTFRCVDPVARAGGCIPINPFAPYTQAMQNYLTINAGQRGESKVESGLAFIGGSLFELPAGPLQFGVGLESRTVTAFLDYDDPINLGLVTGNRTFDNPEVTFGTREAYVEARAPIVRDLPFLHEVNVEGAFRWSDSDEFGKYETYKLGGDWSPIPGLRFRVSKNKAVRTPNLGEFNGGSQTAGVVNDPCATENINNNATRLANCQAEGIPTSYNPALITRQGVQGFVLGNPNLEPEEADTLTYGLVFNAGEMDFMPSFLERLTVTVDRFEIEIEKVITTTGRQTIANLCYDLSGAARAQYCALVGRGFSQIEQANYALQTVNDQVDNLAAYVVEGYDVEINYGIRPGDFFGDRNWGDLSFNAVMTFYDKATLSTSAATTDLLGFAGGSTSDQGYLKRQGNFSTIWTLGNLRTSWNLRYIPETKQSPFQNSSTPNIKAHYYHDLQARLGVNDMIEVYGGVNNVTNQEPPFFATSSAGTQALDTIPAYYDVFGRQFYAGIKLRF